jgi:myosin heavy subunit
VRCDNLNKALSDLLYKLTNCFDDASLLSAPSDAREPSNSSRVGSDQHAMLSAEFAHHASRNMRLKGNASSTIRSILEENLHFATSWQSSIENSSQTTQELLNERMKVEELTRKVSDLEQALGASREQEKTALDDAQACKQSCEAMIQDIKEKVANAWELEEQKMLRMEAQMTAMKLEAEELSSAKQQIAEFKQLAAEHDDMLVRLQSKHELEQEHLKLLHEEERVTLKQQCVAPFPLCLFVTIWQLRRRNQASHCKDRGT